MPHPDIADRFAAADRLARRLLAGDPEIADVGLQVALEPFGLGPATGTAILTARRALGIYPRPDPEVAAPVRLVAPVPFADRCDVCGLACLAAHHGRHSACMSTGQTCWRPIEGASHRCPAPKATATPLAPLDDDVEPDLFEITDHVGDPAA